MDQEHAIRKECKANQLEYRKNLRYRMETLSNKMIEKMSSEAGKAAENTGNTLGDVVAGALDRMTIRIEARFDKVVNAIQVQNDKIDKIASVLDIY